MANARDKIRDRIQQALAAIEDAAEIVMAKEETIRGFSSLAQKLDPRFALTLLPLFENAARFLDGHKAANSAIAALYPDQDESEDGGCA